MTFDQRQIRLVLALLAAITAVLVLAWYTLLRVPMVPAYENIREADASAIVTELERAGIAHELANGGHDILVPEDQAAEARVLIAGSDVAMGGTVGFELFNDSDMGLTEFAQKINFQRALQGELSRTIMSMDGIAFARVHLALPERSIFRAEQGEPTAAVTIEMAPGNTLSRQRIEGIRQLVAYSVPGLAAGSVAILDERGDLVSGTAAAPGNGYGAALTERAALEQYYQTKAREAISTTVPGLRFEATVNAREPVAFAGEAPDGQRGTPDRHKLALGVLVRTQTELDPADREAIETALADALELDRGRGDSLTFLLGLSAPEQWSQPALAPEPARPAPAPEADASLWPSWLFTRWTLIGLALITIAALVVRPRRRLDDEEAASFAELLKSAAAERETADAR